MFILKIFISLVAGILVFSSIKPKEFCSINSVTEIIKSVFLESKNTALEYGESQLIFSQGEIRIVVRGLTKKVYRFTHPIEPPPVSKKACSNTPGIPTSKTTFRFSSKGLKDLSGTIYIRCGSRFLAFSVLSPTGGVTHCIFDGDSWEVIN